MVAFVIFPIFGAGCLNKCMYQMLLSPCLIGKQGWAEEGHSDVKFAAEQRIKV